MTDLVLHLPEEETATDRGIVGQRQLVAVQTFDIARLTSHPVVLVPGTFVAVTGRGPRQDSNESGKTSFLAAVSLLLGDPEWRLSSGTGGAAATQLLFEPTTAGVTPQRFRAAPHGYIVGVFADPADPAGTALTVWCRIDTATPHLTVRWAPDIHLAEGGSDVIRHARADELWKAVGQRGELGAKRYVAELYGDAPRCLAYVARRGSLRSAPSLLQMDAGAFTPEDIATALIALTGRATAFETEEAHREKLAEAEERLAVKKTGAERAELEEGAELEWVRRRDDARARLDTAGEAWRLHFARGYLDVRAQAKALDEARDEAREELGDLEEALRRARERAEVLEATTELEEEAEAAEQDAERLRVELQDARDRETTARTNLAGLQAQLDEQVRRADGWAGPDVATCRECLSKAEGARRAADVMAARAQEAHQQATAELDAVLAGGGGAAGRLRDRLIAAGVEAVGLLDAVAVEDHPDARAFWEPRLSLYGDAVAVAGGNLARAAAAAPPGAVLVAGEDGEGHRTPLPTGIVAAPPPALAFLEALARIGEAGREPARVTDRGLGVTVVGGFPEPIAGRDARAAAAWAALDRRKAALDEADGRARAAKLASEQAGEELARAQAAAEARELKTAIIDAERQRIDAARSIEMLEPRWRDADDARVAAHARLRNHSTEVRSAQLEAERVEERHGNAVEAAAGLASRRARLAVDYWAQGWGGTVEAAKAALAGDTRNENTLRRMASDALLEALARLGIAGDGSDAPNEEIAQVARRRGALVEEPEAQRAAPSFAQVTAPLRDWLESRAEQDRMTEDAIMRLRDERARDLEVLGSECERLRRALERIQDAIEQRIMHSLGTISTELDRLDRQAGGFGAALDVESLRPEGPRALWRWKVTPRWRRAADGPLVRYDNQTNSAREKLFTVHLVLAALLAAPDPQGRVLVLDELGDSLGVTHRRDVLRAIAETAPVKGITVLGTCQDSVLPDATEHCGEVLYFSYPSRSEALNHPTRMFGFDADRTRVELTADALRAGRPPV